MEKFLFCLGVTKGGTTWLHWVLSQHPELAFIARKEIHYFLRQHGGIDRLTDFARMRHFADHVGNYGLHRQDDKKGLLERSSSEDYGMPWDAAWNGPGRKMGPVRKNTVA